MSETFKISDIETGFHPDGYRIDKTASPMNFYTQWQISGDGRWHSPKPVDYAELPQDGWFKFEGFDWDEDSQERSA